MAEDVVELTAPGIRIELVQRPSKALRKFGHGRIAIYLNGNPVWLTQSESGTHGIEWTLNDLLSFLTSNWSWLLNEQDLPLSLKYSPEVLAGTAADIWEELAQKNHIEFSHEEKRTLRAFCQRHDLAEATSGIALPSLFMLRMAHQFLFSSRENQVLVSIEEGMKLLSQLGDTISNWMKPYADASTQPLLDAWATRNERVRHTIDSRKYLLARMSKDSFEQLSDDVDNRWGNTWTGPIMFEGAMFAAARMTAGFVPIAQQLDILQILRSAPATPMQKIDRLSGCLRDSKVSLNQFDRPNTAFVQGYALAERLRECLSREAYEPLDPAELLNELGVAIHNREWADSPLDALSCWSDEHGPLIILNVADEKRCTHEYGRRFTLAHELCHLLVDRGQALGLVDVFGGRIPSFIERRANAFAAEMLFPRELAAHEYEHTDEPAWDFILRMRHEYRAPRKTIASQIFNSRAYYQMDDKTLAYFENEVRQNHMGVHPEH